MLNSTLLYIKVQNHSILREKKKLLARKFLFNFLESFPQTLLPLAMVGRSTSAGWPTGHGLLQESSFCWTVSLRESSDVLGSEPKSPALNPRGALSHFPHPPKHPVIQRETLELHKSSGMLPVHLIPRGVCSALQKIRWPPGITGCCSANAGLCNEAWQRLPGSAGQSTGSGRHSTGTMTPFKIIQTNPIDFSPWKLVSSPRRDQAKLSFSCEQCFIKPSKERATD